MRFSKRRLVISAAATVVAAALIGSLALQQQQANFDASECSVLGRVATCVLDDQLNTRAIHLRADVPEDNDTLVLLDLGGPGVSRALVESQMVELSDQYSIDIVVQLEAYTSELSDQCHDATERHLRLLSTGDLSEPEVLWSTACAVELGREAEWLRDAGQVLELVSGDYLALSEISFSFGATRAALVTQEVTLPVRSALVSPVRSSSGETKATDLLTQRADAIRGEVYQMLGVPCERPCRTSVDPLLDELASTLPTAVSGRSVPFSSMNLAAALYGAAYDPFRNGDLMARALTDGSPTPSQLESLSIASDSVMQRFDIDSYGRNASGYFLTWCNFVPAHDFEPIDLVGAFVEEYHSVCDTESTRSVINPPKPPDSLTQRCVYVGTRDPIARPGIPRDLDTIIELQDEGHFLDIGVIDNFLNGTGTC